MRFECFARPLGRGERRESLAGVDYRAAQAREQLGPIGGRTNMRRAAAEATDAAADRERTARSGSRGD